MAQETLRTERLREYIAILASEIGERNLYRYENLQAAARFIEHTWHELGYRVSHQAYEAKDLQFANLEIEIPGTSKPEEIVILGAHYDTHEKSPGANDNGSAIAALLELARVFSGKRLPRTLRFVAFTNEEHPFTRTAEMGSRVYARRCHERKEEIRAMICLETIGYCSEQQGSQRLSFKGLLLPRRGNFIALVGNRRSKALLSDINRLFRSRCDVPCKALTLPTNFPGAWSSDHWSFWKEGYPGVMLTDTAPLRYRYYHTPKDTPEKVSYDFLTRVVNGLEGTISSLARSD
jgi:Zn-dependent M28 family amino/carboxypeptidase